MSNVIMIKTSIKVMPQTTTPDEVFFCDWVELDRFDYPREILWDAAVHFRGVKAQSMSATTAQEALDKALGALAWQGDAGFASLVKEALEQAEEVERRLGKGGGR